MPDLVALNRQRVISFLAIGMSIAHMVMAAPWISTPDLALRGIHLTFGLVIGFLIYGCGSSVWRRGLDGVFIAISIVVGLYAAIFHREIVTRPTWVQDATLYELVITFTALLVVLELTRRVLGVTLVVLCLVFIVYGFLGPYMAEVDLLMPLAHSGVGINEFVDQIYFSTEGIFGVALGVSSSFIFLFVVFGALLQKVGGGDFFIDLTRTLTGRARGGPAKMAVLSSALMASMSGSAVANVATTGSLTIPMMRRLGYPNKLAGAIEALASTGGQLTPPVMGAGAFIMAAILGIEYQNVILAALLPAILFFLALFIAIHCESLKRELPPMEALTSTAWEVFKRGWTFLLPLGGLITLLVYGYTPQYAAFYGVLFVMVVPYVRSVTRIPVSQILSGLRFGAESAIVVVIACAAAGIIVGMVRVSGLGFAFSSLVTDFSGGSLGVALVIAMLASFVFGMGMPTTPAYVIQATLVAPALVELGAEPLSAHLFVFYFAVLGQITPPVCVAAFAAAPIAQAKPLDVGIRAFVLGLPVYIIPFLFVGQPELLGFGAPADVVIAVLRSIVAISLLSLAVVGWFGGRSLWWTGRAITGFAALALIFPNPIADAAGLAVVGGLWLLQRWRSKQELRKTI